MYQYKGKKWEAEPLDAPTYTSCGTASGYRLHSLNKTPRCQPCKDAHAKDNREWRQRWKRTVRSQCATYPGYMRHKRAGEQPCDMCLTAYAQYMRDYRAKRQAAA